MHREYIRSVPDADAAVLFIHGFLGSPRHFDKFVSLVPDEVSVYNILLDGHGGSVKDFSKSSMKKWKNQIGKTVDELCEKYDSIIICAHSMGTFFAMSEAVKHSDKIKKLFLLQSALKIGVKMTAVVNSAKSLFGLISDEDEVGKAYSTAHSVKLNLKLWQYAGWIARYVELFKEAESMREAVKKLETPTVIFQSKKDELVSFKSVKYIPKKDNITLNVLQNSAHFIYDKKDYDTMLVCFKKIIEKENP